jgi:Protein of unknown function (DUF3995)
VRILSIVIFILLTVIAALHAYWAFGGLWPAATEQSLVATVIGAPEWSRMPSMPLTMMVAGLIFAAGIIALSAGGVFSLAPKWLARIGAGVLALIFIGRGLAGYSAAFASPEKIEPFATLNFWYYSPLCLAIGGAFLMLVFAPQPPQRNAT